MIAFQNPKFYNAVMSAIVLMVSLTLMACGGGITGDEKNYIVVKDQTLINLDEVVVSQVEAERDVIIVIYESDPITQNSKTDTVVGFIGLTAGTHSDVSVKFTEVDREIRNNEIYYAELRNDNGLLGELELDGTDTLITQSSITAIEFQVKISTTPYLDIAVDENKVHHLSNNQRIDIRKVISDRSTWIVIHRDVEGQRGQRIGTGKIDAENTSASIELSEALIDDDKIIISLYENVEVLQSQDDFDPQNDRIIMVEGEGVSLEVAVKAQENGSVCKDCAKFSESSLNISAYIWSSSKDFTTRLIKQDRSLGNPDILTSNQTIITADWREISEH